MKKFISVFLNLLKLSKVTFTKSGEYSIGFEQNQLRPIVELVAKLGFIPDYAKDTDEFILNIESKEEDFLVSDNYDFTIEIWKTHRVYTLSLLVDRVEED